MWLPKRLFGPLRLHRDPHVREKQLRKFAGTLYQNHSYEKVDVLHELRRHHVHRPEQFFESLLEHGLLHYDEHTGMYEYEGDN